MVVVSATLEPEILVEVVVLVSMDLVQVNGAYKFAGPFALGWTNLAMSSLLILEFPFFLHIILGSFGKGASFCKWIGVWVEQASVLCHNKSSHYKG